MNRYFDEAFAYILKNEGVDYTNDPKDSGGPTKFGITQRDFEIYIGRIVPAIEIKEMHIDIAKSFYFNRYWKFLLCDHLDRAGIAICIFDTSILYGVGTAALLAQRTVSLCGATLKLDAVVGDKTVDALNIVPVEAFLNAFHGLVLARIDTVITENPKNEVYRKGWTSRANRLLTLINIDPVIDETT